MFIDFLLNSRIYGIDSFIEFLSMIISCIISYYSYRIYKTFKKGEFKYFSIAFLLIAISFLFKILSNLTFLYYEEITEINSLFFVISNFEVLELINFFSFLFYKLFNIIGFLMLFFIFTDTEKKEKIFLFSYLSLIVILFSIYLNSIFELTVVFILIFLTYYFYRNYEKLRTSNTFLVFIGFLFILISRLIFIFSEVHELIYFSGEIFRLLGFIALLVNLIKIKNEQKKNKVRSYKRHFGSFE